MPAPTRRQFLATATGTATLASTAGCIEQAQSIISGGYPGFKKIDWVSLDVLRIVFSEDHSMDGFGIAHEHTDNLDNFLVLCQAPQFTGPVHIPLIDMIRRKETVYPSRTFKAVAYTGSFDACGDSFSFNYIGETLGSQTFEIPASIMPQNKVTD